MIMQVLRMIAVFVWLIITTLILFPVILIRLKDPSLFILFLRFFAGPALWLLGVKVEYSGASFETICAHQPVVFIGNHQSGLDVITIGNLLYPRTVAVGKMEILYIPVFGFIFWACGGILINRKLATDAMKRIARVGSIMKERRVSIAMMPEGTRNRSSHGFLPFKKGAFRIAVEAQVPIVPIVSGSLKELIDPKTRLIRPGKMKMRTLEPILTKGLGPKDVDALLERTRSAMWNAFVELNG